MVWYYYQIGSVWVEDRTKPKGPYKKATEMTNNTSLFERVKYLSETSGD